MAATPDRVQPFIETTAELNFALPLASIREAIYAQRLAKLQDDAAKSAEAGNPVAEDVFEEIRERLEGLPATIGETLTAAKFVLGDEVDATKLDYGFFAVGVANLLHNEIETEDLFELADQVLHLRLVKDALKDAAGAVQDEHDRRLQQLYDAMLEKEVKNLTRGGQTFYLTTNNFVQADKEQGGTTNPNLIAWLERNGMKALAAKSVNANSLRGAANKWLEQHPVSIENDDYDLDGPALLERLDSGDEDAAVQLGVLTSELDIHAAEIDGDFLRPTDVLRKRIAERNDLLSMLIITQEPTVGIRKAAK